MEYNSIAYKLGIIALNSEKKNGESFAVPHQQLCNVGINYSKVAEPNQMQVNAILILHG